MVLRRSAMVLRRSTAPGVTNGGWEGAGVQLTIGREGEGVQLVWWLVLGHCGCYRGALHGAI
jgi:hypothetical protein